MTLTHVSDRYEIAHELGRGGMAVVFLARQTDLDRWVALKELRIDGRDESMVRRFLRESRLAGSLSHPNIVTVLDFFEAGGTGYIAMEYVPRGSLRPYVGRLTFAQTAGVLEGVLAALVCAEQAGIVHRDLKPENVMVTADGRVKLADFGIAKANGAASMLTATGTTLGTPHYMAPEQAMGQALGPWTDLYSVGCMAYELVTGRLPFGGTDATLAVLMRHINEAPRAGVRGLRRRRPPALGLDLRADGQGPGRAPAVGRRGVGDARGARADGLRPPLAPHVRPPTARQRADPGPVHTPTLDLRPIAPGLRDLPHPTRTGAAHHRNGRRAGAGDARAADVGRRACPAQHARVHHAPAGHALFARHHAGPRGHSRAGPRRRRVPRGDAGAARFSPSSSSSPAAGAVVLARPDDSPPPPARVSHAAVATVTPLEAGKVRVTLPPGWDALSLPVNVPGLPRERAAAPGGKESDGVVLAGMAPRDAHNRALLSPRVGKAKPTAVKLGDLAAYRYDGLRWNGRRLTVYAAPTSAGVATVACLSPAPDCARIAESLTVPGAKGFPLGADRAFAAAIRRALDLPPRSLAQDTPAGQASAARRIAADLRTARTNVARVKAGPADEPLRADLARRLAAIADAYTDLGTAAAGNARGAYASAARRARTAEGALRETLRRSVYDVRSPRARSIPALRRPPAPPKPKPTPVPTPIPRPHVTPTPIPRIPTPDPKNCADCGDWQDSTGGES